MSRSLRLERCHIWGKLCSKNVIGAGDLGCCAVGKIQSVGAVIKVYAYVIPGSGRTPAVGYYGKFLLNNPPDATVTCDSSSPYPALLASISSFTNRKCGKQISPVPLTGVSHTEQIAGRKMVRTFPKQFLSIVLSVLLGTSTGPLEGCRKQAAQPGSPPSTAELQQTGYSGQGAPLSADELQQLVAPIALYPDALVAQILGAATFPDQVAAPTIGFSRTRVSPAQTLMQAVDTAAMGSQREGAHTVSFGPRQPGEEPQLDLRIRRGVPHAGRRCDVGGPGVACQGQAAGNLKSGSRSRYRATVAAGDRDSAYQSAGGVRSAVQPHGCLRHSVCDAGVQHRGRGDDRLLAFGVGIAVGAAMNNKCAVGLQLLELQLARWRRRLQGQRLLRKQRVARRLLRFERDCVWSVRCYDG